MSKKETKISLKDLIKEYDNNLYREKDSRVSWRTGSAILLTPNHDWNYVCCEICGVYQLERKKYLNMYKVCFKCFLKNKSKNECIRARIFYKSKLIKEWKTWMGDK